MKKFMFAAIAIVAICAFVVPANAEKMMFGVKAGVNLANFIGDDVNQSIKMGALGGLYLTYNISDVFAIQPELLYTMKGATSEAYDLEFDWKFDYIEIPLLLKVNIPTEGKIKPSLYAGPAFGFLLTAEFEDLDLKDDATSTDIGLVAGGEIGYKVDSGMFTLEARYEVGFTSIDNSDDPADLKNSVISFLVGYGFAF